MKNSGSKKIAVVLAHTNVDVINVETNITNVAIRIMRDGVRVFTKGGCDHPEDIDLSIIPVIVVLNNINNISTTVLILDILLPVL